MIKLAKTLYKVYPLYKKLQRTNSTHQCYTPQADLNGPGGHAPSPNLTLASSKKGYPAPLESTNARKPFSGRGSPPDPDGQLTAFSRPPRDLPPLSALWA